MSDISPNLETRWLPIRNDSGELIPAFGLVELTEVVTIQRRKIQTVIKPSANSLDGLMLNSPTPIRIGGFGTATKAFPNFVKFNTNDGTPVNGEIWGSVGGSFELGKSQFGFQIIGGVTNGIVEVVEAGGGASDGGGCGDLLIGWRPNDIADGNDTNCAGTAIATLLSTDVPSVGGVNTTARDLGFIGRNSWKFNFITGVLTSTLWVNDSPDFVSVIEDFTIRFLWNMFDTAYTDIKFMFDLRAGISVSIERNPGSGLQELIIRMFHTTGTQILTFAGISSFLDDVWYVIYLRWKQSTRIMTVNAMAVETDLAVTASEDLPVLPQDIDVTGTLGIFVGDAAP